MRSVMMKNDEESGPSHIWGGDGDRDRGRDDIDIEEYHHRDMMLGLGELKDGMASVNSPVSPAGTNLGSSRPGGTYVFAPITIDVDAQ